MEILKNNQKAIKCLQKEYESRYATNHEHHGFYIDRYDDETYTWKFEDPIENRMVELIYCRKKNIVIHCVQPK